MPLLAIQDLYVHFALRRGFRGSSRLVARAVDGFSLEVRPREVVALVGESGSGKTTVARAILGLVKPTSGRISFEGNDLVAADPRQRREARRHIQTVFQDPYSSLSPRLTIRDAIAEPLKALGGNMSGHDMNDRVLALLEMVGLDTQHLWRRPHEFSGGQCQRIAIARALALEPKLLLLDEPTSALDVSVQARILLLLRELRERLGLAYLLIAHDLAVVQTMSDRVAVMYLGRIVEQGSNADVLKDPKHPYSIALLSSVPSADPTLRSELTVLEGDVPSPAYPPSGCHFHPRCPSAMPRCSTEEPLTRDISDGHVVACHLYGAQEGSGTNAGVTASTTTARDWPTP